MSLYSIYESYRGPTSARLIFFNDFAFRFAIRTAWPGVFSSLGHVPLPLLGLLVVPSSFGRDLFAASKINNKEIVPLYKADYQWNDRVWHDYIKRVWPLTASCRSSSQTKWRKWILSFRLTKLKTRWPKNEGGGHRCFNTALIRSPDIFKTQSQRHSKSGCDHPGTRQNRSSTHGVYEIVRVRTVAKVSSSRYYQSIRIVPYLSVNINYRILNEEQWQTLGVAYLANHALRQHPLIRNKLSDPKAYEKL